MNGHKIILLIRKINMNNDFPKYQSYSLLTLFLSNILSAMIYGLGFFILSKTNRILPIIYLFYIMFLEIRLIRNHCRDCFYWGKICGFGKGKISSWFFKKGNNSRFCNLQMTWKNMIPDILIFIIPVIAGLVLLIIHFNVIILFAILLLILLITAGNGYIRGTLVCKFCRQRDLGCPADRLFNKQLHK